MTKFFLALFSLLCTLTVAQQVQVNPGGLGEITVNGYEGATRNNILSAQIHIYNANAQNTPMDKWSLTYKVNGTISNGSKTFPPDKIKLRFNSLSYQNTNDANIIPTASNLLLKTGLLPLAYSNSYFTQNSTYNLTLVSKYYLQLTLNYDAVVDSGTYLAQYSSGDAYTISLTLEVRDKAGVVKASGVASFTLRIVPVYGNYGMIFDPAAQNVSLVFNSANAYTAGVSKTFSQAFSTVSTTGYTVKVSALSSNLTSSTNSALPVNAIQLRVRETTTQAIKGTITLSTAKQNVINSNTGHTTKFFDTTYFTTGGDARFMNKTLGQYSGTLVFEMAPK